MRTESSEETSLLHRHMPELDVLRGVAILTVVVYHGFYWMNHRDFAAEWQTKFVNFTVFGWLGVSLFFVLSGFLITGILLDTKSRPGYYRTFYLKRAARILPALALTLLITVVLRVTSFTGVLAAVFFLVNYATYLGIAGAYSPLWSLAVEEHFYLLWPLIVHRLRRPVIAAVAIVLCTIEPVLRYYSTSYRLGDPHENTHLVADYLATGALLAIFFRSPIATRRNSIVLGLFLLVTAGVALLAGIPHGILHRNTAFGEAFQIEPFNLIFAGTVVLALAWHTGFFSSVWMWPFRFLGYISYGLYLYHLLVFDVCGRMMHHFHLCQGPTFAAVVGRFALMAPASILVSYMSRRWFEQWFLGRSRDSAAQIAA